MQADRRLRPGRLADAATIRRALVWGFAVLMAVYLALSGGGYDIVVRSEIGLIVWWFVLLGLLIGVLPYARIGRAAWIAAALLGGFLVWTWIGLSWSPSHELTLDEVGRLSTYLGIFVLGLCVLTPETIRPLVNGLGCGIAAVCTVAIMSKLVPGQFPADTASSFYNTPRLLYPFDYSDGVGEYAALGLPLVLYMATGGRTLLGRSLGTAAVQPVLLCLAMTVSRGGILAAVVGTVAFLALVPNRIPRLVTLGIAAAGIAVLMLALLHRAALRDSTSVAPAAERHSMLVIFVAVLAASALVQAVLLLLVRRFGPPIRPRVSRRGAQSITLGLILAAVFVIVLGAAAGTVGHLWREFKLWHPVHHSNEYSRLLSVAGSHRYQYWQVAWKAFESSPVHGIGSGTFRYYWDQHTTHAEFILNAHSLWFETLAETGIVGWVLLAGFFATIVIGGAMRALRSPFEHRTLLATATAGVIAFCGAASFDWVWQIGVVPMVTMLLAAVTLVEAPRPSMQPAASGPRAWWQLSTRMRARVALGLASMLTIVLIAIPLASSVAVLASQRATRSGNLSRALADVSTAQAIEPGAASPYLQEALVLEKQNDIAGAAVRIADAIKREPLNSQLWVAAERIAIESDHPRRALADYLRAKALYPTSFSP